MIDSSYNLTTSSQCWPRSNFAVAQPRLRLVALCSLFRFHSSNNMVQILLKTLNGSTRCFELPPGSSVFDLKAKIAELEGIPLAEQRLISNDIRGISFAENYNYRFPHTSGSIFVTLALSLLGGKGGFGSLLRGGPQGIFFLHRTQFEICMIIDEQIPNFSSGVRVKKITNYDSCRDLETGRRLKYVNQVCTERSDTNQARTQVISIFIFLGRKTCQMVCCSCSA